MSWLTPAQSACLFGDIYANDDFNENLTSFACSFYVIECVAMFTWHFTVICGMIPSAYDIATILLNAP